MLYGTTSRRQAAARELKVLQQTMLHRERKVCTLRIWGQWCSGMGLSHRVRPARRFASCSAAKARGWSMVLVSERMSRVVEALRTAGDWVQSFCSAEPKSVPLP